MSRRRVKNINYCEEDDDFDDYDYDEYDYDEISASTYNTPDYPANVGSSGNKSNASHKNKNLQSTGGCVPTTSKTSASGKHHVSSSSTPLTTRDSQLEKPNKNVLPKEHVNFLNTNASHVATIKTNSNAPLPILLVQDVKPIPPQNLTIEKRRLPLSLVVVGHADSGKSTLMGHLLYKMGECSVRLLKKLTDDSRKKDKKRITYAWILDEGEDERERGVTIDVSVKYFETEKRSVYILDAPGHAEFVPRMMTAAVQADAALLVIDIKNFDAGFGPGGQIKEHIKIVRSLGIPHLLVAVNKMDVVNWDQNLYNNVIDSLHSYITGKDVRFNSDEIEYVPVSALSGINILSNRDFEDGTLCKELREWWPTNKPSIISAIDHLGFNSMQNNLHLAKTEFSNNLAGCISDVINTGNSTTISVKIETGSAAVGDLVTILPTNQVGRILGLECCGKKINSCFKGDYIEKMALGVDPHSVNVGTVICSPMYPLPVTVDIFVKLLIFDIDIPILPGKKVMSYVHVSEQPATVVKLIRLISNKSTHERHKTPRMLRKNDMAVIELHLSKQVCVKLHNPSENLGTISTLSRIILRDEKGTIGAGIIIHPSCVLL